MKKLLIAAAASAFLVTGVAHANWWTDLTGHKTKTTTTTTTTTKPTHLASAQTKAVPNGLTVKPGQKVTLTQIQQASKGTHQEVVVKPGQVVHVKKGVPTKVTMAKKSSATHAHLSAAKAHLSAAQAHQSAAAAHYHAAKAASKK